jgi:hypothetical protein
MRKIGFLLLIICLIPIGFADQIFFDLSDHWAVDSIYWASEKGYVNGYPDGTFRPEQPVTRLEFLDIYQEILLKNGVFDRHLQAEDYFYDDLLGNEWGLGVISSLEGNFQHSGRSLNALFPLPFLAGEQALTRGEAIQLLAWVVPESREQEGLVFLDLIGDTNRNAVERVVAHQIFTGYPDQTIRLNGGLTRAEATIVLQRLDNQLQIIKTPETSILMIPTTIYDESFLDYGNYEALSEKDGEGNLTDDGRYLRLVRTLEYLSFDQQIPFSEKKLYDEHPVQTLVSLRTGEYWNRVGVDYYLLHAAEFSKEETQMLAREMFLDYMLRDGLSFVETKQLFQQYSMSLAEIELAENAYAFWSTQIKNNQELFTRYTLEARDHLSRGEIVEARIVYEWMRKQVNPEGTSVYWIFSGELQRMYASNLIYLDDQIGGRDSVTHLIERMQAEIEELEMTETERESAHGLINELAIRYQWEKIKVLP